MEHQAPILVVDDNENNLTAIQAVLEDLKHPIIYARSAEEALRNVLLYDFSVILLDVQMPDVDGFETARLIRSREKSSYTPIIFLSAWHKDEVDVTTGYALGAVDYIFKPLNPIILRSKVKVFVDLFTKSVLAINLQTELDKRLRAEQHADKQKRKLELAQITHLNTIEEMTSALAHEMNQPLAAISNYVKGCINRLNQPEFELPKILNALEYTANQAERAGTILHRIKNFVRKNELYLEPVAIKELILSVVKLMQDDLKSEQINLQVKFTRKILPEIFIDKIQIEQVLLNLLRNSIDALKTSKPTERKIIIESGQEKPETINIKIVDNGSGLNKEHLSKIFDLYFTTKNKGMGVGLSICRSIIEAHGGNISADNSTKTQGACFQITLPLVQGTQGKESGFTGSCRTGEELAGIQ